MPKHEAGQILASTLQVVMNRAGSELAEALGAPVEATVAMMERMTPERIQGFHRGPCLLVTGSLGGEVDGPVAFLIGAEAAARVAALARKAPDGELAERLARPLTEEDTAAVVFALARVGAAATSVWEADFSRTVKWPSEPTQLAARLIDLSGEASAVLTALGEGAAAAGTTVHLGEPASVDLLVLLPAGLGEALARLVDGAAERPATETGILGELSRVLPLSVRLQVVIAQRVVSLGELRGLAPGRVFDLAKHCNAPLELHAGQRLVARGRVVAIGERFGFCVEEICSVSGLAAL